MTTTEAAAILRSDALCTVGPSRDARMMGAEALGRIDALERELAEAKRDGARVEFLFSALNTWGLYCRFVEEYHPRMRTSGRTADDFKWRAAIDAATEVLPTAMKGPNATE